MKCKYCGGNITLESAYCPYCGKPNEHAQQHARDMENYQQVYEETRSDVQEKAHRFTGSTVRVIIIAILLILIMVFFVLGGNMYSIKRAWISSQTEKNAEAIMMQMDTLLEEEEFHEFQAFCQEKYIETYDTVFEKYMPADRAARGYHYVYDGIMQIACPPEYMEMERAIENLAENLDYFYQSTDWEQYSYYENIDVEKNEKALQAMEAKVELLLQTYCGLTEEEAKEIKSLSKAKRAVLIEEAILRE